MCVQILTRTVENNLVRLRRRFATMLFIVSKGLSLEPATPPSPVVTVLLRLAPPPTRLWHALNTFCVMSINDCRENEQVISSIHLVL